MIQPIDDYWTISYQYIHEYPGTRAVSKEVADTFHVAIHSFVHAKL